MNFIGNAIINGFIGFIFLISPLAYAKSEKKFISPLLYKKLQKADKLIVQQNYLEALQNLQKIHADIKKNSFEEAVVLRSLASVYGLSENYHKGIDALLKCVQLNVLPEAQQQASLLNLGQLYIATEQYRQAIEILGNWPNIKQKNIGSVEFVLAQAYAQLKQYKQAIIAIEKALSTAKKPAESWYQLQLSLYFSSEKYIKASQLLQQLIRKYPEKKQYWEQLSYIYQLLDQHVKATTIKHLAYRKGILSTEKEIISLVSLLIFIDAPNEGAVILANEFAEKRIKDTAKNWELLANAWAEAQELNKALVALELAAKLSSKGYLYQRIGNIYFAKEEWSQAISAFNKSLQKDRINKIGAIYLALGVSHYEQKQYAKSKHNFIKAEAFKSYKKSAKQWLAYISHNQKLRL